MSRDLSYNAVADALLENFKIIKFVLLWPLFAGV